MASRLTRARPPAPRRRSAALVALVALGLALACASLAPAAAGAASHRFTGQVTDTLRNPTHRIATPASSEAGADLVFVDATHARTKVRTCVKRLDVAHVRTCFDLVTGAAGRANVTPLRFKVGSYEVRWSVAGAVVAHWRFVVVAAPAA